MEDKKTEKLFHKYIKGKASEQESAMVESWYLKQAAEKQGPQEEPDYETIKGEMWNWLEQKRRFSKKPERRWQKFAAAAVILTTLSAGFYFYSGSQKDQLLAQYKNDVLPGGNKAVLTLADGSKVSLTDAAIGEVGKQAGISISKTANGQLVYNIKAGSTNVGSGKYNTIETPAGGQWQLNLPDGSKVWLNAGSSLTFPVVFNPAAREVKLKGEAYFEVAKINSKVLAGNHRVPFIVKTDKQEVDVLGTHFNINSYANEPATKTTLLEGSVKVFPLNNPVLGKLLVPDQEAVFTGQKINVQQADVTAATSWKDGYFLFKNEDIESIMRKVARWYDVDVVFDGDFKNKRFEGSVSRFKSVSEILRKFELTGTISFKIEGRRITVMQ